MNSLTIQHIRPQAGVRGGQIKVYCTGLASEALATTSVVFGEQPTRPALITPTFLLGIVPETASSNMMYLLHNGVRSDAIPFAVATVLADNLHPVANPAVDSRGAVYTTISGTQGQSVPVSIYKIPPLGEATPFASGIVNPAGLAFGPDGLLYVSSRHEGAVYRIDTAGTVTPFARNLGSATGIAFDAQGHLYVGDRRGTIHHVAPDGTARTFARLEPSAASYHLACSDDGWLYVSYPTLSGTDQISRIAPDGTVHTFVRGLGRAQGLAFDREHNLYVVAYVEGTGGVVRITPEGEVQHVIAGLNLVGLAFRPPGTLVLADNSTLYALDFAVSGRPLP